MSKYRRNFVPGGTYFFTVVAHHRRPFLTTELARRCLREAIDKIRLRHPLQIDAFVLLPDHLWLFSTVPAMRLADQRFRLHPTLLASIGELSQTFLNFPQRPVSQAANSAI